MAYRTARFSIALDRPQEAVETVPFCFPELVVTPMNRGAVERDTPYGYVVFKDGSTPSRLFGSGSSGLGYFPPG